MFAVDAEIVGIGDGSSQRAKGPVWRPMHPKCVIFVRIVGILGRIHNPSIISKLFIIFSGYKERCFSCSAAGDLA
jgi:hypothetical protein